MKCKLSETVVFQADYLYFRNDGSDFNLGAFSWLFNEYWNHPAISYFFKEKIIAAIIQLPFWYISIIYISLSVGFSPLLALSFRMNESGNLNTMQYWSENHQIGWKSGKYLIGQAFANNPDLERLVFIASQTNGSIVEEIGGQMVRQWLEYRSRH